MAYGEADEIRVITHRLAAITIQLDGWKTSVPTLSGRHLQQLVNEQATLRHCLAMAQERLLASAEVKHPAAH